ncbi:3'(2'),5'-bisphosphate nucleotidase CysQ [Pelagibacterium luteolum]|uniref:3'(2'),5'-bisphosphate nucleotidase CysQ n=1 Tax=Pelagibacterium luteolum TaxID=440168 RepID=A0A1G7S388_9HYPH|nr:3'(2'),5'-bisphosphate nucleotidase CysQ [Pelagibacterium luteolum]SDG17431.1 3'(2'), 5'-bisphosphate nucleotidase [Pelagibacterium luteolum]
MMKAGQPDINLLVDIALDAGKVILAIYGRAEIVVSTKADASPLTEADLAAEALITERLVAAYPDIPIVAEEAAAAGQLPDCGAEFFLVDPLDGSKEFIARNGEFTVNIAVISGGVPMMGVVYAPALERIWWGEAATGSFTAQVVDGRCADIRPIAVRVPPERGLTLVGSRSHGGNADSARLAKLIVDGYSSVGSSLKFCMVAEGQADLYPRLGRTMEWDTAAGDAILRAAGGVVLDETATPLSYGKRNQIHDSDFANPHFWAVGHHGITILIAPQDES